MSRAGGDVPEEALIDLQTDREALFEALPILGAVKLFELGKLYSGRAARLAGVSRGEFRGLLGHSDVSSRDLGEEELRRDTPPSPCNSSRSASARSPSTRGGRVAER